MRLSFNLRGFLLAGISFFLSCAASFGTEGVSTFEIAVNDLAYDSGTGKLYASSATETNTILQIDPTTGASSRISVAGNPGRLVADAGHGLWIGLNALGAVARLDPQTLSLEDPIPVGGATTILDLSPSSADAHTLAVAVRAGSDHPRAYLIRRGVVLPDSVLLNTVALAGTRVFGYTEVDMVMYGDTVTASGLAPGPEVRFLAANKSVALGDRIYGDSGLELDAPAGEILPGFSVPFWAPFSVAVNANDDSIFFLAAYNSKLTLHRFDRLSRIHNGFAVLGPQDSAGGLVALGLKQACLEIELGN